MVIAYIRVHDGVSDTSLGRMTLIPGVASARAPVVNEIGETRDMQVLVLGRHRRSGWWEDCRRQSGNKGFQGCSSVKACRDVAKPARARAGCQQAPGRDTRNQRHAPLWTTPTDSRIGSWIPSDAGLAPAGGARSASNGHQDPNGAATKRSCSVPVTPV